MSNTEKIYKISKHAKERYVERIAKKETVNDIQTYIVNQEEKIEKDINKMIQYGNLIYSDRQEKQKNLINTYVKDLWIILVDISNSMVITLFEVDLGCGKEFNEEYMKRMLEKLDNAKVSLEETKKEIEEQTRDYREKIEEANQEIAIHRKCIKNLENLSQAYKDIIENNVVEVTTATHKVTDIVNDLFKIKVF